jgi:exopolysaccharide biosynthesis polyprenyl glycosylphosphotransferase
VSRKLRLEDFGQTFLVAFTGSGILFFVFIIHGIGNSYRHYFETFVVLFLVQFHLTFLPRLFITSYFLNQEKKGRIRFNTILIGHVERIKQVCADLNNRYPGNGHHMIGYIPVPEQENHVMVPELENLGGFNDIHHVVKSKNIEDVIIALEENSAETYHKIIYELNSSHVVVKVNPELYSVVQKQAIISSLFRYPLIEVSRDLLRPWQAGLKQLIDILGAFAGLIITLPVSLFLVAAIRLTSKGPVFYSHERIGSFGKPFRIIKFRSMCDNAEENGPQLSSSFDTRITPIGRFMRRFKLDEIPNFLNVLLGEMSLVGPRPERKYYIDQIVKRAPEYTRLLKVKPGVTSWGQVKYGYAENVDEMIRRMRYDLLYVDNMSIYVDFQILLRTLLIILRGRTKEKN